MIFRPITLYDRESEWDDLVAFATRSGPRFRVGVVYGRRRFGKSFLLRRLVEGVGGFYHLALEEARGPALARFASAVGQLYEPPAPVAFPDWEGALRATLDLLGRRKASQVLVLDEYPYLRSQSPELDSAIQSLADSAASGELGADWTSSVSLILCGSALSVMTDLLGGTSPLRGRAVLDMPINVFDYRQARQYWNIEDPETAFGLDSIVGGAAGYKDLVASTAVPQRPGQLTEWVTATVLNPSHALFREDEYLLREDPRVTKQAIYYSMLGAVAAGRSSQHEIAAAMGKKSEELVYSLGVLVTAGFVTRDEDLLVKRSPVYRVADPIVRFHELVSRRHQALLEDRKAEQVWHMSQDTYLSKIVGPHFEGVCRVWASRSASVRTLGGEIGAVRALQVNDRELEQAFELDVVAATRETSARRHKTLQVIGEAKGTKSSRQLRDLERLDRIHELLRSRKGVSVSRNVKKLLFGMRGFDTALKRAADSRSDVELVDLERLYHGD